MGVWLNAIQAHVQNFHLQIAVESQQKLFISEVMQWAAKPNSHLYCQPYEKTNCPEAASFDQ